MPLTLGRGRVASREPRGRDGRMTRARLLLGTNKLPELEPEDGNHREPCNEIFIETARSDRHRLQHFG